MLLELGFVWEQTALSTPSREKEVSVRDRFQGSSVTRVQEGSSVGKAEGTRARVPRLRAAASIPDAESTHHGIEGSRNTFELVLEEHCPAAAVTEGKTTKMSNLLDSIPGPPFGSHHHSAKFLNDSKESKG